MTIRIVGAGCPRCKTVEKRVFNVLARLDIDADVRMISQVSEFSDLGVFSPPGLLVNGVLVSQGRIPTEEDIETWVASQGDPAS